jgi:predicted RNase H-like HicB family nuclease
LFKNQIAIYSVVFPDLNWLATQGDTLEEALEMAVECLAGYLYICQMDNDVVPLPSKISDISPEEVAKELDADKEKNFPKKISPGVACALVFNLVK